MMPQRHSESFTIPPPPRDPVEYRIISLDRTTADVTRQTRIELLEQTLFCITETIGTYTDRYFLNFKSNNEILPPGSDSKLGCQLQELLQEYMTRYYVPWELMKRRVVLIVCTDAEPQSLQRDELIEIIGEELHDAQKGLVKRDVSQIQFELIYTGRDMTAKAFLNSTGGWIYGDIIPDDLKATERFDYEDWLENVLVGAIYLRIWET